VAGTFTWRIIDGPHRTHIIMLVALMVWIMSARLFRIYASDEDALDTVDIWRVLYMGFAGYGC
jgi:hypothetical protein